MEDMDWTKSYDEEAMSHCWQLSASNIVKCFYFQWCDFPHVAYWHSLVTCVFWSYCWTCLCDLIFLAHTTLVSFSASGKPNDTCLPLCTLQKHSIEQIKNNTWASDPAQALSHSYWGWQKVEECPALLWRHATCQIEMGYWAA